MAALHIYCYLPPFRCYYGQSPEAGKGMGLATETQRRGEEKQK